MDLPPNLPPPVMFLYDFVHVDQCWDDVANRIMVLGGSWLEPLVRASHQDGEDLRLRVGLGGKHCWFCKEVRVTFDTPVRHQDWLTIAMTWDATRAEAMFPHLEADLEIAPIGNCCTQISLRGRYDPPMGQFGNRLDSSVLHRVAEATARSFLFRVAEALNQTMLTCSAGESVGILSQAAAG